MNIVNEKLNDQVQELKIEIFKNDYAEKVEAALKRQRRKAAVPGFRVGNAPMGMIRKMYYNNFLAEEVNQMIGEALYGYLRDNKLEIILEPMPVDEKTIADFENGEDFTFVFEYALQPELNIDFKKLPEVRAFNVVASEQEKEEYITQLRRRHGEYSTPETIDFDDDFVTLQYEDEKTGYFHSGDLNDKGQEIFKDKKLNDSFEVSLADIFKDEAILARFLKVKEEDLEKGNKYTYTVQITSIGRIKLAELNEDFFKKAFPDGSVKDEKEFNNRATSEIEKRWMEETDRFFMNEAIGTLLDNIQIAFPDEFVKRFILASQQEMTKEALEEKYEDYRKSFIWQLIENKLSRDNEIKVTEDDMKEYVRNFFMQNYFANFNPEDISERLDTLANDALKNKEDAKKIYDTLFDKKIEAVLKANLKINQTKGDYAAFIEFVTGEKKEKQPKKAATAKKEKSTETEEKPAAKAKKEVETDGAEKKKSTPKKTTKKEKE